MTQLSCFFVLLLNVGVRAFTVPQCHRRGRRFAAAAVRWPSCDCAAAWGRMRPPRFARCP